MQKLPIAAEGDEASKLYEQLMKQIERLNADKVGEFSNQCQSFGTCSQDQAVGTAATLVMHAARLITCF
jgi:hypothetical protein